MTTDPFTEAANAAAREYAQTPRMNVGTVRDRIAEAHMAGAEWARDYLAAQEPTDAEVEAAAVMIARDVSYDADPDLSGYRIVARTALSAARAVRNGASHE